MVEMVTHINNVTKCMLPTQYKWTHIYTMLQSVCYQHSMSGHTYTHCYKVYITNMVGVDTHTHVTKFMLPTQYKWTHIYTMLQSVCYQYGRNGHTYKQCYKVYVTNTV